MASTDLADDPAITEELIAVLSAAEQPMTLRQIVAASPLFGGGATVAGHLASLVNAGIVERDRDEPNKITFELRRGTAAPSTYPADAPADAPQTTGHADLILAALRDAGQLTRRHAAQAAGCSPKRASDVFGILKARGLAILVRPGLWAATAAFSGTDAAPKKPATESRQAVEKSPSKPADQSPGNHDADAPAPAAIIIALRSDGIVEIRRTAAAVIEITPDEMAELQRFVASLRSARG